MMDSIDRVGMLGMTRSEVIPGGDAILPRGMVSVIQALERRILISGTGQIQLEEVVSEVDWSGDPVVVTSSSGDSLADHVILTLPIGVLQSQHRQIFTPALPEDKVRSLERTGAGRLSKIFAEWEEPWWSDGQEATKYLGRLRYIYITLIVIDINDPAWSKEELESARLPEEWYKSVMGFNVPHGQERMLYMFVAGDGAAVVDMLEEAEIINTIGDLLSNFTGRDIPPPDRVFRHQWTTDPHTQCGYSYPTTRSSPSDWAVLQAPLPGPRQPRLLLAGEHCSQHLAGYANGARDTGLLQAGVIIRARGGGEGGDENI